MKKSLKYLALALTSSSILHFVIPNDALAATAQPTAAELHFAKCAATYDFLIATLKRAKQSGGGDSGQLDSAMSEMVTGRAVLGSNFFKGKSVYNLNPLINTQAALIKRKMLNGSTNTSLLYQEAVNCRNK